MTKPSITTKQIVGTVIISFLVLFGARFYWMQYFNNQESLSVTDGIISVHSYEDEPVKKLEGDWEFYPNLFIQPNDISMYENEKISVEISNDWRDETLRNKTDSYGKGTYHLQLDFQDTDVRLFSLYFSKIYTAAQFYLDGELISSFGNWDDNKSTPVGDYGPHKISFTSSNKVMDLVIHVDNHENPLNGGITGEILFGTAIQVEQSIKTVETFQIIIAMLYLFHVLYICLFLFLGRGQYDKELIYFAILLFLHAITIVLDDYVPMHLPISAVLHQKILLILFISVISFLLIFITHLFQITSRINKWIIRSYMVLVANIVILPIEYMIEIGFFIAAYYLIALYVIFHHTIKTIRHGHPDAMFVLLFIIAYTTNVSWGTLIFLDIISMPFYPFDFILTVISLILLILRKYIRIAALTQKQTEELKIADKEKDEFLANAAHELRNPLHGMINIITTTLLNEPERLNEKTMNNLQLVNKIGQQMKVMVNDILDAQQISYDELHLFKKPIQIDRLVKSVWQMVSFSVQNKHITFDFHPDGALRPVWGDENRVTQILFNILHNAVKYSNDGEITVHARLIHQEKMMEVIITDDGIGMNKGQMEQLFERYKHQHHKHYEGGLGIGLHITKQLVEMHGGTITAHSLEGVGSTITFTLPVATDIQLNETAINTVAIAELPIIGNEFMSEPIDETPKHQYKPLILAVDDDAVNLKILHDLLSNHYELTTTTSPEEALSAIHDKPWDLIISDVMMPTMSGYALTEKIREVFQIHELPILLLTAKNQIEDIHSGFLVGANDYVAKPMEAVELLARVRALTEVKQSTFDQLRMEAAWLQAQIKPHFLFNILNSIAALSEIDTQRMIQLLDKFGTYLQRSFHVKNTYPLIPITEELILVEAYTYIESERFGERLAIEWQIPDKVDFSVPPLSVQTLVENAIRHGVLQQPDGGTVTISVEEKETTYTITITDDGVGMDAKTMETILHPDSTEVDGIGIANTNRRLTKLFGTTLTITSKVGHGTSITMYIPKK